MYSGQVTGNTYTNFIRVHTGNLDQLLHAPTFDAKPPVPFLEKEVLWVLRLPVRET